MLKIGLSKVIFNNYIIYLFDLIKIMGLGIHYLLNLTIYFIVFDLRI